MSEATLMKSLKKYETPHRGKALWQLANTLIPYALLLYLMTYTVLNGYTYWLTLALAVIAGLLLVRAFIIFHDCTHGSFFASRLANTITGYVTGILAFTPFDEWRHSHGIHHATAGDLDRRGVGDVWTMTVAEYRAAPRRQQIAYRFIRHPLVTFGLGPAWMFLVMARFPASKIANARDRRSVYITDLAILAIIVIASLTIGFRTYVLVQLPVILIAGAVGIWLFYVQHQFESVYWARHEALDRERAALEGSSYYKLPPVLQWFSGNIGFHHIHHLRARIPNYNLQQCYEEIPALQEVPPLTIRESLRCAWLDLYDEQQHKLIRFRDLRTLPA